MYATRIGLQEAATMGGVHRLSAVPVRNAAATVRRTLAAKAELARPLAAAITTLDTCFGGCEKLGPQNVCTRYGSGCERRAAWLSVIRTTGCDKEGMKDEG